MDNLLNTILQMLEGSEITLEIFFVTLVIALALKATMGWRISDEDEAEGVDQTEHAETAYDFGSVFSASRIGHRPARHDSDNSKEEVTA